MNKFESWKWMSIIMQKESNVNQIYLTHEEVQEAFSTTGSQSLILFKINQDTVMKVQEPICIYNNISVKQKYQINSDPIDAEIKK